MISAYIDKPWFLRGEHERDIDRFVGISSYLKMIKENETLYETNIKNILAFEESPKLSLLLYGPFRSGKTTLSQFIAADRQSMYYAITEGSLNHSEELERKEVIEQLFDDISRNKSTVLTYIGPINEYFPNTFEDFIDAYNNFCHVNRQNSIYLIVIADNDEKNVMMKSDFKFNYTLHVPLPNIETRIEYIKMKTKKWELDPNFPYLEISKEMNEFDYVRLERVMSAIHSRGLNIHASKFMQFIHYTLLKKDMFKTPKLKVFYDEIEEEKKRDNV